VQGWVEGVIRVETMTEDLVRCPREMVVRSNQRRSWEVGTSVGKTPKERSPKNGVTREKPHQGVRLVLCSVQKIKNIQGYKTGFRKLAMGKKKEYTKAMTGWERKASGARGEKGTGGKVGSKRTPNPAANVRGGKENAN